MIHELKIESSYFDAVAEGNKHFEIRENDRDFRAGDILALNEVKENAAEDEIQHTGRSLLAEVTYVLTDERFLKKGWAVLEISLCGITFGADDNSYGELILESEERTRKKERKNV